MLSLVAYLQALCLAVADSGLSAVGIKLAIGGVTLLAVGGVVYSLGVIFYVCKRTL